MATIRQQRISSLLREELDIMIGHELEDPRVSLVTVTDVIVSRDIRNAKIYVHHNDDEVSQKDVLAGLRSAASYLRGEIAVRCGLRMTPELIFYYDETPQKAQRIEQLLRQIAEDRGDVPTTDPSTTSFLEEEVVSTIESNSLLDSNTVVDSNIATESNSTGAVDE